MAGRQRRLRTIVLTLLLVAGCGVLVHAGPAGVALADPDPEGGLAQPGWGPGHLPSVQALLDELAWAVRRYNDNGLKAMLGQGDPDGLRRRAAEDRALADRLRPALFDILRRLEQLDPAAAEVVRVGMRGAVRGDAPARERPKVFDEQARRAHVAALDWVLSVLDPVEHAALVQQLTRERESVAKGLEVVPGKVLDPADVLGRGRAPDGDGELVRLADRPGTWLLKPGDRVAVRKQPRLEAASSLVARWFGLRTPPVELVGDQGGTASLQPWMKGLTTLGTTWKHGGWEQFVARVQADDDLAEALAFIDAFARLVALRDRNGGNTALDDHGLISLDYEEAFFPNGEPSLTLARDKRLALRVRELEARPEFQARLRTAVEAVLAELDDPRSQAELRDLLTDAEIADLADRATQMLTELDTGSYRAFDYDGVPAAAPAPGAQPAPEPRPGPEPC
jgi:hypothetical protein